MVLEQNAGFSSGILGKKLLAYILLFSSLVTTVTSIFILYSDYLKERNAKDSSLAQIEVSYLPTLSQSLWNVDSEQLQLQLSGIKNFPYIAYAKVQGTEGELEEVGVEINTNEKEGYELYNFNLIHYRDESAITIGTLSVVADVNAIYDAVYDRALMIILAQFIKTTIVSIFVLFIVHRLVTRHMQTLANWAEAANLEVPVALKRRAKPKDELDQVVTSMNAMRQLVRESLEQRDAALGQLEESNHSLEQKVDERTAELLKVIDQLNESFKHLSATRKQLVETEKMAQMGSLVAGVAHELNTPLGICVTICSMLEGTVQDMENKKANTGVTKQDFDDFLGQMAESVSLMSENVDRASSIIQSFKRLAVKQSSATKITVKFRDMIEACLVDESVSVAKDRLNFEVQCPSSLEIETYEGTIETIFVALVVNSIEHGMPESGPLKIQVDVYDHQGTVRVDYRDNGVGMDEDTRDHVFEPFYTSARHKGHVGLGMHLTYNLVTQILSGSIRCLAPTQGQTGARFKIEFPKIIGDEEIANEES